MSVTTATCRERLSQQVSVSVAVPTTSIERAYHAEFVLGTVNSACSGECSCSREDYEDEVRQALQTSMARLRCDEGRLG